MSADKPATPCPASRIRYGLEVTPGWLARVDRAETAVRMLLTGAGVAVTNLRVRDLSDVARLELPADDLAAARTVPGLEQAVAQAGFGDVAVECPPFRSGNLNER